MARYSTKKELELGVLQVLKESRSDAFCLEILLDALCSRGFKAEDAKTAFVVKKLIASKRIKLTYCAGNDDCFPGCRRDVQLAVKAR